MCGCVEYMFQKPESEDSHNFSPAWSAIIVATKAPTATSSASATIHMPAEAVRIGRREDVAYWDGMIDEVRITAGARSSNWVWAAYQTAADNSTFTGYGVPEIDVLGTNGVSIADGTTTTSTTPANAVNEATSSTSTTAPSATTSPTTSTTGIAR